MSIRARRTSREVVEPIARDDLPSRSHDYFGLDGKRHTLPPIRIPEPKAREKKKTTPQFPHAHLLEGDGIADATWIREQLQSFLTHLPARKSGLRPYQKSPLCIATMKHSRALFTDDDWAEYLIQEHPLHRLWKRCEVIAIGNLTEDQVIWTSHMIKGKYAPRNPRVIFCVTSAIDEIDRVTGQSKAHDVLAISLETFDLDNPSLRLTQWMKKTRYVHDLIRAGRRHFGLQLDMISSCGSVISNPRPGYLRNDYDTQDDFSDIEPFLDETGRPTVPIRSLKRRGRRKPSQIVNFPKVRSGAHEEQRRGGRRSMDRPLAASAWPDRGQPPLSGGHRTITSRSRAIDEGSIAATSTKSFMSGSFATDYWPECEASSQDEDLSDWEQDDYDRYPRHVDPRSRQLNRRRSISRSHDERSQTSQTESDAETVIDAHSPSYRRDDYSDYSRGKRLPSRLNEPRSSIPPTRSPSARNTPSPAGRATSPATSVGRRRPPSPPSPPPRNEHARRTPPPPPPRIREPRQVETENRRSTSSPSVYKAGLGHQVPRDAKVISRSHSTGAVGKRPSSPPSPVDERCRDLRRYDSGDSFSEDDDSTYDERSAGVYQGSIDGRSIPYTGSYVEERGHGSTCSSSSFDEDEDLSQLDRHTMGDPEQMSIYSNNNLGAKGAIPIGGSRSSGEQSKKPALSDIVEWPLKKSGREEVSGDPLKGPVSERGSVTSQSTLRTMYGESGMNEALEATIMASPIVRSEVVERAAEAVAREQLLSKVAAQEMALAEDDVNGSVESASSEELAYDEDDDIDDVRCAFDPSITLPSVTGYFNLRLSRIDEEDEEDIPDSPPPQEQIPHSPPANPHLPDWPSRPATANNLPPREPSVPDWPSRPTTVHHSDPARAVTPAWSPRGRESPPPEPRSLISAPRAPVTSRAEMAGDKTGLVDARDLARRQPLVEGRGTGRVSTLRERWEAAQGELRE